MSGDQAKAVDTTEELELARADRQRLAKRVAQLEQSEREAARAIADVTRERDETRADRELLRGQLHASRSRVEQLERELADMRAERDAARGDLALEQSLTRQLRQQVADAAAPTALDEAANEIARLCGCAHWDYPGQLVRDVKALVDQRDAARAALAEPMVGIELADEMARLCDAAGYTSAEDLVRGVRKLAGERDALRLELDQARSARTEVATALSAVEEQVVPAAGRLLQILPRERRANCPTLSDVVDQVVAHNTQLLERLADAVNGRHDAHVVGQLAERLVASVPGTLGPELPLVARIAHLLGVQEMGRHRSAPVIVLSGNGPSGGGPDA